MDIITYHHDESKSWFEFGEHLAIANIVVNKFVDFLVSAIGGEAIDDEHK